MKRRPRSRDKIESNGDVVNVGGVGNTCIIGNGNSHAVNVYGGGGNTFTLGNGTGDTVTISGGAGGNTVTVAGNDAILTDTSGGNADILKGTVTGDVFQRRPRRRYSRTDYDRGNATFNVGLANSETVSTRHRR